MNRIAYLSLSAMFIFASAAGQSLAGNSPANSPSPQEQKIRARIQQLSQELNLTDDQKVNIKKIVKAGVLEADRVIRDSQIAERNARANAESRQDAQAKLREIQAERKAKLIKIRDEEISRIAQVLDDDQKAKLKEIRARKTGKGPAEATDDAVEDSSESDAPAQAETPAESGSAPEEPSQTESPTSTATNAPSAN